MNNTRRFPKLRDRMSERGFTNLCLDDLNATLSPLGFRVIEEDEVIEATLQDAERFLERLDESKRHA